LASWIAERLSKEPAHIMTVEDPIEYVFEHGVGLVNQCEVGCHFSNFSHALGDILRRDPDVIMAGELRDLDSVRLALRAAETGHLVLATLHSSCASDAVSRLINVFPPESEQFVRHVVSNVLLGVVAQRLVKSTSPHARQGRVANYEVLTATPAVRHLIKDQKENQLSANMQTGAAHHMFTFAQHLTMLQQSGLIAAGGS
jgi:twitching motility protein PilT